LEAVDYNLEVQASNSVQLRFGPEYMQKSSKGLEKNIINFEWLGLESPTLNPFSHVSSL
jgi:phage-related protein